MSLTRRPILCTIIIIFVCGANVKINNVNDGKRAIRVYLFSITLNSCIKIGCRLLLHDTSHHTREANINTEINQYLMQSSCFDATLVQYKLSAIFCTRSQLLGNIDSYLLSRYRMDCSMNMLIYLNVASKLYVCVFSTDDKP